jgi:hypothetical protein
MHSYKTVLDCPSKIRYIFSFVNIYSPICVHMCICGPRSSVGIATGYGLDDPKSNPGGYEIFRPSRLQLGPTQHPVKWVPCFP